MSDQAKLDKITDFVTRRRLALKRKAATDIAQRLFDQNGSVTTEEVAAMLEAEYVHPPGEQLLHQARARARSAVRLAEEMVDALEKAAEAAQFKIEKHQRLLRNVEQELQAAQDPQAREQAEQALTEAKELLAYLEQVTDEGPPGDGESASARAGLAEALATMGGGAA